MSWPPIAYWFTGGALVPLVLFVVAGLTWWRAAVTEFDLTQTKSLVKTQRGNIDRVKELLGDQIAAGEQLIRRLNKDHLDQDQTRAEEWATKTHDLIRSAYGSGEAAIFLSNANYVFYGEGGQYSLVKNFIDGRLRRLTELIPRTDTLPLRGGFDPDTWAKAHPSQPQ
jgi:hypothetical protein